VALRPDSGYTGDSKIGLRLVLLTCSLAVVGWFPGIVNDSAADDKPGIQFCKHTVSLHCHRSSSWKNVTGEWLHLPTLRTIRTTSEDESVTEDGWMKESLRLKPLDYWYRSLRAHSRF
jgi:hypothetical protein